MSGYIRTYMERMERLPLLLMGHKGLKDDEGAHVGADTVVLSFLKLSVFGC